VEVLTRLSWGRLRLVEVHDLNGLAARERHSLDPLTLLFVSRRHLAAGIGVAGRKL
jgi:hypothetical protein